MSDHDEIETDVNNVPQPDEETPASAAEPVDQTNQPEDADQPDKAENDGQPEQPEDDAQSKKPKKSKNKRENEEPLKIPLFAAVIAVLAVAVLTAMVTFLSVSQKYHSKLATVEKERFSDSKLTDVDALYRKYYINGIEEDKLVDGLIYGYVYGSGDKYGSYMTSEEYAQYNNSLDSKAVGIGVSVVWNTDMSAIEVVTVYKGSSAEEAGILSGDIITKAGDKDISALGFETGVSVIKGDPGTKITLTVLRGENHEQTLQIEVERRENSIQTVTFDRIDNIAVIGITNFYSSTPDEFKAAVAAATDAGCDRIIFDLRNNPGGLVPSVREVLDFILPEGVIVRMKDAEGIWTEYRSDASCLEMPMVILVNGNTASAAELFTSSVMDYGYAYVIGTQTYGKGTVVGVFPLSDGSAINISMQLFYPPESDNFEGVGITPDEILDLDENAKKIGLSRLTYENDNQLQRAVEVIKEK